MATHKIIRFTTAFTLASCLLILTSLSGCGSENKNMGGNKPVFEELSKEKLMEIIHSSPKPYILVNFYATWCGPCRKEMPGLVSLENSPSGNVQVVLVSIDEESVVKSKLQPFLEEYQVNFKSWVRFTNPNDFIRSLYVLYDGRIPTSLLYNNKGELIEGIIGMTSEKEIQMAIENYKMMKDV